MKFEPKTLSPVEEDRDLVALVNVTLNDTRYSVLSLPAYYGSALSRRETFILKMKEALR